MQDHQVRFVIDDFRHTADMYVVHHIIKKHGDEKAEKARGQEPITEDDIAAIPDVVMHPDSIILGVKNDRQQEQCSRSKRCRTAPC
jgi:hypothetical protein